MSSRSTRPRIVVSSACMGSAWWRRGWRWEEERAQQRYWESLCDTRRMDERISLFHTEKIPILANKKWLISRSVKLPDPLGKDSRIIKRCARPGRGPCRPCLFGRVDNMKYIIAPYPSSTYVTTNIGVRGLDPQLRTNHKNGTARNAGRAVGNNMSGPRVTRQSNPPTGR